MDQILKGFTSPEERNRRKPGEARSGLQVITTVHEVLMILTS